LNWVDLVLYGNAAARDVLESPTVCESCKPGVWTLKAKNLDRLVM
jgi:hypothetical protein